MTDKKLKVEFAPGCFDHFDGTQEELDELMADIMRMVETGELSENATLMTEEDFDELPEDVKEQLMGSLNGEVKRTLQ